MAVSLRVNDEYLRQIVGVVSHDACAVFHGAYDFSIFIVWCDIGIDDFMRNYFNWIIGF